MARPLRESEQPVGRISHRVGYTSEFAFSRAFSKHLTLQSTERAERLYGSVRVRASERFNPHLGVIVAASKDGKE